MSPQNDPKKPRLIIPDPSLYTGKDGNPNAELKARAYHAAAMKFKKEAGITDDAQLEKEIGKTLHHLYSSQAKAESPDGNYDTKAVRKLTQDQTDTFKAGIQWVRQDEKIRALKANALQNNAGAYVSRTKKAVDKALPLLMQLHISQQ